NPLTNPFSILIPEYGIIIDERRKQCLEKLKILSEEEYPKIKIIEELEGEILPANENVLGSS
ncbi:12829_t:CDS:2, partial [Funneliformis mosseae]